MSIYSQLENSLSDESNDNFYNLLFLLLKFLEFYGIDLFLLSMFVSNFESFFFFFSVPSIITQTYRQKT